MDRFSTVARLYKTGEAGSIKNANNTYPPQALNVVVSVFDKLLFKTEISTYSIAMIMKIFRLSVIGIRM